MDWEKLLIASSVHLERSLTSEGYVSSMVSCMDILSTLKDHMDHELLVNNTGYYCVCYIFVPINILCPKQHIKTNCLCKST